MIKTKWDVLIWPYSIVVKVPALPISTTVKIMDVLRLEFLLKKKEVLIMFFASMLKHRHTGLNRVSIIGVIYCSCITVVVQRNRDMVIMV